jgi:hypothetical protein
MRRIPPGCDAGSFSRHPLEGPQCLAAGACQAAWERRLEQRRLANPVTFCDGHGIFFVAASGRIQMAADSFRPSMPIGPG